VWMPSLKELERWMGTGQVADKLGYSRQYVINLAKERKIRAVKTGAGWLYDPDSIETFAAKIDASKAG
jgi:excisionase family DNA binding protein